MSDMHTALTAAMGAQGTDPADDLVNAQGRSVARDRRERRRCPQCGAGPERRVASAGFGLPHPVCGKCGHEWCSETWEGGER